MKTFPPLHVAKADALIHEAAQNCLPVVVTWNRHGGGKESGRARLLDTDQDNAALWMTRPVEWDASATRMPADGLLTVSFEQGTKTCWFESCIVTDAALEDATGRNGRPVKLEWPTEVFEQQRRQYDRVGVPPGCQISVTLHRIDDGDDTVLAEQMLQGRMIDLSPGGLSMELPGEQGIDVQAVDRVICAFAPTTGGARLKVWGRVRHGKRTGRGSLRLGLQFLDLHAGLQGQLALKNIVSLTSRFRLM